MLLRVNKPILGLGHPRTGTGFTSKLLNSWGLNVGHETMKKHGIVAWQLINPLGPWPYITEEMVPQYYFNFKHIIYNVRDPKTSIPSIVYTEDTKAPSVRYRRQIGVGFGLNKVENAIKSILYYDYMVGFIKPDFTYRIEDQAEDLYDFLNNTPLPVKYNNEFFNTKVNSRNHNNLDSLKEDLNNVDRYYKIKLNEYCDKYQYDKLF